ncbi:MAG TPA: hypothetical protein VKE70_14040 [Candidatus Solibacter sp.]|nr:hypothetical protein [Candidatus Solibacter sp.]
MANYDNRMLPHQLSRLQYHSTSRGGPRGRRHHIRTQGRAKEQRRLLIGADEARRSIMNVGWGELRMSIVRDKIVFNLSERTGNIWILKMDQK